jgi:hypothetical protein
MGLKSESAPEEQLQQRFDMLKQMAQTQIENLKSQCLERACAPVRQSSQIR